MHNFTKMILEADEYAAKAKPEWIIQSKRREILEFANQRPELVDEFFQMIDTFPEWQKYAKYGISFSLEKFNPFLLPKSKRRRDIKPEIVPLIWSDTNTPSGRCSVIRITMCAR